MGPRQSPRYKTTLHSLLRALNGFRLLYQWVFWYPWSVSFGLVRFGAVPTLDRGG